MQTQRIIHALKSESRQIASLFHSITTTEKILFIFFFCFYGLIGYMMLFHTSFIDVQTGNAGSYLGYDNLFHLKTHGGAFDFSHPFFNVFHVGKAVFTLPLQKMLGAKAGPALCLLIMNLLVSGTLFLTHRYLTTIVSLKTYRATLLTSFLGVFFTTIVLSFTTESYPFSFCFLVLSVFIISSLYKNYGYIQNKTLYVLAFLCGGVTITNAAKPVSALLLNNTKLSCKIRDAFRILFTFFFCVILVMGLYSIKSHVFSPEEPSPIETTQGLTRYFIHDSSFSKQVITDFLGNTVMSTSLTIQQIGKEEVLRPSVYTHSFYYAAIFLLYFLLGIAVCLNRKNKYVQLILFYLGIDVVIHFFIRYGMNEAVIFGGHWMFVIPILFGWLYNQSSTKVSKLLDITIIGYIAFTLFTNATEFMRLWNEYAI